MTYYQLEIALNDWIALDPIKEGFVYQVENGKVVTHTTSQLKTEYELFFNDNNINFTKSE